MTYDFMFSRALELHQDGRFAEAEQLYRQILETAPKNPDILNLLLRRGACITKPSPSFIKR